MTTNVQNLQKSKTDVVLDIAICQANAETSQPMKIDDLLANPEIDANSSNLLNNDQIEILNTLEESITFVLQ